MREREIVRARFQIYFGLRKKDGGPDYSFIRKINENTMRERERDRQTKEEQLQSEILLDSHVVVLRGGLC